MSERFAICGVSGGGESFSPLDIPSLVLWLNPSDATVVSDFVVDIADSSSSNNDATAPTVGARPQYFADIGGVNGQPTIGYDGGEDQFDLDSLIELDSGFTLIYVVLGTFPGANPESAVFGNSIIDSSIYHTDNTHTELQYEDGSKDLYTHLSVDDGFLHTCIADSGRKHYLDGFPSIRGGALGAQNFSLDRIATRSLGDFFSGTLGDLFIFNTVITIAQKNQMLTF